jgi:hypothetical protein
MNIAFYHTIQNLLPSRVIFHQGYNDFAPALTITWCPEVWTPSPHTRKAKKVSGKWTVWAMNRLRGNSHNSLKLCLNRNNLQVTASCWCNPLRPLYVFIEMHEEVVCESEWFDRFILKTWRLKHPRILTSPAACGPICMWNTASHITGKPRSTVYRRGLENT